MLRPLTRIRKEDGRPYARRREVVEQLEELVARGREEILVRLRIGNRKHAGYVRSECIVYLLREARRSGDDAWLARLFVVLDCRVRHGLAYSVRDGAVSDAADVREDVREAFYHVVARGLTPEEPDRLDPWEVMFDGALAALRIDLYGAQRRRDRKRAPLDPPVVGADGEEFGQDFPAPRPELTFGMTPAEFEDFRKRALASIELLPEDVRLPVTLFVEGVTIESGDPDEMTIAKRCGVTGRTVHNRIGRGVKLLRKALGISDR